LHEAIAQKKPWTQQRGLSYLMNVHRLDFDASGIVLFCKSKAAALKLTNLFSSVKPNIQYAALCRGVPRADSFVVNAKLAPNPLGPAHVRVDRERGKAARTVVQVREKFSGWALVQCEPLQERLEQVQAHLQHAGVPLAGASCYGGRPLLLSSLKPNYRLKPQQTERPLLARAALHAEQIVFPHPETEEIITLTAPWQKDLTVALKYLRMFAKHSENAPGPLLEEKLSGPEEVS
jgi:23S rRNA-/tRNA-specific pseudouridylate synthase